MNRTSVIHCILILAVFGLSVGAQDVAPPPEHERKVYIDEKEQHIYWPMSMPFWVRLTASPEKDAPSYLLQKVYPGSGGGSGSLLKNGITLEIEGRQFIRWYNVKTDETVYLKFYADGEPPVTVEALEGAPIWTAGEKVFYGKGLGCTLSSGDGVSGVEQIYMSMDGKEFENYTGPFVLDVEKDYHLRFYAVDRVGYAGAPVTVRFTVDHTPPETRYQVHTNFSGDVLSTATTLQLISGDGSSGLSDIFYLMDDQAEPSLYKGKEIALDGLPDGDHCLTYYSVDNVRNFEEKKTYDFYLDRIPPESESRFTVDHHREDSVDYISPRTLIELSASDNKIGVERIEYLFREDKKVQKQEYLTYSEPFKTPFKSGTHSVVFRAVDKLGNLSAETELPVRMDDTAPRSTYSIEGPRHKIRDTIWITRNTTISLSAVDDAAGVRDIHYQLGAKAEHKIYTDPIVFSDENRYLFKFYSVDRVANREIEQPYVLVVDNTPPKVIKTFSLAPTGTEADEDGNEIDIYPRYTSLFLGAVDNSVGIAGVWYILNDDEEKEYSSPFMFKEDGKYTLNLRLRDHVGNAAEETIRFIVREIQ